MLLLAQLGSLHLKYVISDECFLMKSSNHQDYQDMYSILEQTSLKKGLIINQLKF